MGLRLAAALWEFWRSGYINEGSLYLETLLSRVTNAVSAAVQARAFTRAAWLATVEGHLERGETLSERGLTHTQQVNDPFSESIALNVLGTVERTRGEFAIAATQYDAALGAAHQAGGDQRPVAIALANRGILALLQGDDEGARQRLEEALTISQEIEDDFYVPMLLNILGRLARQHEDYPRAVEYFQQGLALAVETDNTWTIAAQLSGLAGVAVARGKFKRAARMFGADQALRKALNVNVMPGLSADHEQTLADVRAQLSEAEFKAAWAEGYAMSLEQAVAYARKSSLDIEPTRAHGKQPLVEVISERELEVLRLLAVGLSNQDIAQQLMVTEGTIKRHTHNIFAKLDVRNRTQALLRAKELDLI